MEIQRGGLYLKVVRGLATKRYDFSNYHIFKRIKHVCVEQHLYI